VSAGLGAAIVAGAAVAAIVALFAVALRANQIITGTAVTLLALGLTGTLYRSAFGAAGAALGTPTLAPLAIPGLVAIPVIGPALFAQPVTTYLAMALAPIAAWWLSRTHAGLALRACGENPAAALAAGIPVGRMRAGALIVGGGLGGLAGGTLVLAQAGTFVENMSAGRGFIAIAIVVLGRWRPVGAAVAALLFGAASALQYAFQAMDWHAPYQLFLAMPYVLTLAALAAARSRFAAPAALGEPLED
jgi:simple sugar transport system permease protein